MTQTLINAKRLHGALLLAADAAGNYVEMLEISGKSETYTNEFNMAMESLIEVVVQVSEDNKAAADAADEASATASAALLAELEAEADAEFEREEEEAEIEAEIIARIEEENAASIEAIAVQNVAAGLEVDDERFIDGINRAENYLPPLAALSDAEQIEVERVLNDASPFPGCVAVVDDASPFLGCDASRDVEGTSGAAEPVRVDTSDITGTSEAPAKDARSISANPFGGIDYSGVRGGYVPVTGVRDGATIFDYAPETD